jgi:hypothetical protein
MILLKCASLAGTFQQDHLYILRGEVYVHPQDLLDLDVDRPAGPGHGRHRLGSTAT